LGEQQRDLTQLLRQCINDLPKNKEIFAFCKISLQDNEAQTILDREGYKDVKFMDGGIEVWPYEVVVGAPPANWSS
jgi:rhodanese-related sulfurtransferase